MAAALALGACADRPLGKPTLTPLTAVEKTMDCPQIHLAIDRADTVRWLIRDSGGKLETSGERAARYAGNMIVVPLTLLAMLQPVFIDDSGHAVLSAADARILELLQLKRAHECEPRVTSLPGLNDLALLVQLESVQAKIEAGTASEAVLFEERTRLLDGLRVVPAAAPVPGQ